MFDDSFVDPRKQAMLMLAAGLLAPQDRRLGKGGQFAAALSQGMQGGLLGFNNASREKRRAEGLAQETDIRRMQAEQMRREAERAQQIDALAPQYFQPAMTQDDPTSMQFGNQTPEKQDTAGYAKAVMAIDPERGMRLQPKPQAPIISKPGDIARDAAGNQLWKNDPLPEKQPDWMNPDYRKWRESLAKNSAPVVNVGGEERAFDKEYGKTLAESYGNLMKADISATSKLNTLGRMESLLNASGNTGKLAPALLEIKKTAASLGIEIPKEADYQQASQALSNQLALEARNPSGGAGMPGALSDKDREYLRAMIAGDDKTPGANSMIIETHRRLAKRDKDVAKMAREYRAKNGRFDDGFYTQLSEWSARTPLFADLMGAQGEANDLQGRVDEARRRGLIK